MDVPRGLTAAEAARPDGLVLTCGGVSMEPAIRIGQEVRVRSGTFRRGCVAAFVNRRGSIELHRLILSTPALAW